MLITPQTRGKSIPYGEEWQFFVLEWEKMNILSLELAAFKRELSDMAAKKTFRKRACFFKIHPKAASSGVFLRACEPLLASQLEETDWDALKPLLNDLYFAQPLKILIEKNL